MLNDLVSGQIELTDAGVTFAPSLARFFQTTPGCLEIHVPADVCLRLTLTNAATLFSMQFHLDVGARLECGLITEGQVSQSMQIQVYCQERSQCDLEHALLSHGQYDESLKVYLQGKAAAVKLRGLQYGRGKSVLQHNLAVYHEADETCSDIEFRGVADEQSRVIFAGLIHVPKHVKGIDANEQSRNILLSNRAEIQAKPELEIYSNDIAACRHGASIGNLDENALFYLQSRGFVESEARLILINAFMASLFERIQLGAL